MSLNDVWIVIPVGSREEYLKNLIEKLINFSGRIVFINNAKGYTKFPGVHHMEDFGELNIYRWWNKGIRYAKDSGAKYVLVLNDDIEFENSFIEEMYSLISESDMAIIDVENSDNGGGAAWIMNTSYNFFANESFRWWYGDTELFDRAKKINKFQRTRVLSDFKHLCPNDLMFLNQQLQDLAREDAETYTRLTELKKIYENYSNVYGSGGGDKGTAHDYLGTYAKYISKRNNSSLLEIGVFRGESIKMWREYIVDGNVYGVDISLAQLGGQQLDNVFVCDATDENQINNIFSNHFFDYIIDDGSHMLNDQLNSFNILYPKIKSGGIYFIEDILGDEPLAELVKHVSSLGLKYFVSDTRRPETTDNDLILVIFKD